MQHTFEIQHIFIAGVHSYYVKKPALPGIRPMEDVAEAECVAGKGLVGDRYFGHKEDYKGQVTFHAAEVLEEVCRMFGAADTPRWITRRNVITRGLDLNDLIGREFSIGPVRFAGVEECAPCAWMDRAIGAGARASLEGRGGLRARILSSGRLARGRAVLEVSS